MTARRRMTRASERRLTRVGQSAARHLEPRPFVEAETKPPTPKPEPSPEEAPDPDDVVSKATPLPPRPVRPDPDGRPARTEERPPVIPEHWNRENRRASARQVGRQAKVDAKYYGQRFTLLPLQLASYYPAGARRLYEGLLTWWLDPRTLELSDDARASGDIQLAVREQDKHERHVRRRGFLAFPALVGTVTAPATIAAGLWHPATRMEALAAGLVWVEGVGWCGRPRDRRLIPSPFDQPGTVTQRKPTGDLILTALRKAKKQLSPEDDPATILAPGVVPAGDGWEVTIDLPPGATAEEAMDLTVHRAIASALRVTKARLEISPVLGDDSHAGRISLFIANSDPWTRAPVPSPLIKARTFSVWDDIPFGVDSRGRTVHERLIWMSWLIGAMPRQGKTAAARLLAAAAALDPRVEMLVANGKGGKDWAPTKEVASWYGSGVREFVVEGLVAKLTEWLEDMRRRYDILEDLDDQECPDGKVTPKLVDARNDMRLRVIFIDEVQEYLDDPEHGDEIKALLTKIAKLAPATGYMLVLATQKPDGNTLPTSLRDQIVVRCALKTANAAASMTVLGKFQEGIPRPENIPGGREGTAVLSGGIWGPGQMRTHTLNVVEFRKVCQRGRELREAARTLTGYAAGDVEEPIPDRFLEHVLAAFEPGEAGTEVWSEVICERLGGGPDCKGDHPQLYSGIDPKWLANALLRYGISTKDKGEYIDADERPCVLSGKARAARKTRKAVVHEDVRRALAAKVKPSEPVLPPSVGEGE